MADKTDKSADKTASQEKKSDVTSKRTPSDAKLDKAESVAKTGTKTAQKNGYIPRLQKLYQEELRTKLVEDLGYKNLLKAPRLTKIVLNMGVGEAVADSKKIQAVAKDLEIIAGQKPVITKAKKSIAGFKVRVNMPLGVKVTLRRARMYEFLDRLINVALPRVRDFRGLSANSFDEHGNYALGLREHIVFPEIDYDKVDSIWGMDIAVCTSATNKQAAKALLEGFNFPFSV